MSLDLGQTEPCSAYEFPPLCSFVSTTQSSTQPDAVVDTQLQMSMERLAALQTEIHDMDVKMLPLLAECVELGKRVASEHARLS